jgi:AcrR family transcriptional regulator
MPKPLSERERAYIKDRLVEEAKTCLALTGIRKTTVDELVRRVNIPKGTFYLFYESKERLFFDAFRALHDDFQEKMMAEIAACKDELDTEKLTDILFGMTVSPDWAGLLRLATDGELELLYRKLPPELTRLHEEEDERLMQSLVSLVGIRTEKIRVFSAAFRGVFLALLHRREVGEEVFPDAMRVMIRGIVLQMFEEGEKI